MQVNILVEGRSDEPVAKKLLKHVGLEIGTVYGGSGKPHLLKQISIYNQAARFAPWFALVDLDMSAPCPSQVLASWLPEPAHMMRFRIAIRAIETWLMADKDSIARFLGVSLAQIPSRLEFEDDPKQKLVDLTRKSRNRSLREDIVPRPNSGAKVGPLYVARLTEFTENHWRPDEAEKNSESLRRCIKSLSTLKSSD